MLLHLFLTRMCSRVPLVLIALGFVVADIPFMSSGAPGNQNLIYIGTYTGQKSQGIYSARFNPETGEISDVKLAAETKNPTFLAVSPDERFLYAANEIGDFQGKPSGAVSAFSVDKISGELGLLNQQPSGGSGPCHVSMALSGKCVLVANYGSGSVAAYEVDKLGRISEPTSQIQHHGSSVNKQRQEGPHAHFIAPAHNSPFVLSCDLGLDQVLVYRLDPSKGTLALNSSAAANPGAGPRHLAFHPKHRWVYVVNELDSTVSFFDFDANRGLFQPHQTVSTVPAGFKGNNSGAEIAVHPSGKWVYTSNRGDNSIAIFSADAKTGTLSLLGCESTRGKTPRHFAIHPSGNWLIAENQDSNDIFVFRIDLQGGTLHPVGGRTEVGAPVCVVFLR